MSVRRPGAQITTRTWRTVDLDAGPVDILEAGDGPPVVFLHGALVDASLWDDVIEVLVPRGFKCIAPTLPLGAHRQPMHAGADLSLPGLAALVAQLIRRVSAVPVTIVSNDSGTAIAQVVIADHQGVVAQAVLTNGDAFDYFFPRLFRPLQWLAYVPGGVGLIGLAARWRLTRSSPLGFGRLTIAGVDDEMAHRWSEPIRANPLIRRDTARFLRAVDRKHTNAVAGRLSRVDLPVLLAWADADRVFPRALADRLAAHLTRSAITTIPASYTFIPIDAPTALADAIDRFLTDRPDSSRRDT